MRYDMDTAVGGDEEELVHKPAAGKPGGSKLQHKVQSHANDAKSQEQH